MNLPRPSQGVELWKMMVGILLTALISVGATHLTFARDVPSRSEIQALDERMRNVEVNVAAIRAILEQRVEP